MKGMTVTISVKDLEPFEKLVKTMKKITEDTRISEDIRQEYLKEIEVIMMSEQNTIPVEELEESPGDETNEEQEDEETNEDSEDAEDEE